MTRQFRLGLFLALAAAVGLHLRPCLGCLVSDGVEMVASGSAVRPTAPGTADSAPSFSGSALASLLSPRRPSMMAVAVRPRPTTATPRVAVQEAPSPKVMTTELSSGAGFGPSRSATKVLRASSVQTVGFHPSSDAR